MKYAEVHSLVVEPTPLKNMSKSVGIIIHIWKNKKIFQTTNQLSMVNRTNRNW